MPKINNTKRQRQQQNSVEIIEVSAHPYSSLCVRSLCGAWQPFTFTFIPFKTSFIRVNTSKTSTFTNCCQCYIDLHALPFMEHWWLVVGGGISFLHIFLALKICVCVCTCAFITAIPLWYLLCTQIMHCLQIMCLKWYGFDYGEMNRKKNLRQIIKVIISNSFFLHSINYLNFVLWSQWPIWLNYFNNFEFMRIHQI